MSIFKKQIKFVSATCPECNGHLQLDTNLKTAYCQYCGAQCIVENVHKKEHKEGNLEIMINFFERQQLLHHKIKNERFFRKKEEERRRIEYLKKFWWAYLLGFFGFFALLVTMIILESNGII